MRWSELEIPFGPPAGADPEVLEVVYDSRRAGPGRVFFAIRGTHVDGHDFVPAALRQGVEAVVVERAVAGTEAGRLVVVPDSRAALAQMAAAVAGHPSRRLPVVGVTGTDGKTTTAILLQAALTPSLVRVGSITTVDFRVGERVEPNLTRQTTLEAPEVQLLLARMLREGCRAVALEATSHALVLHRVDQVQFAGAVFTNVTHDHLDFHGSWDAYLEAKARLLAMTREAGGFAVLNRDDRRAFPLLNARWEGPLLTYSASGDPAADVRATALAPAGGGWSFTAVTPHGEAEVRLQLSGRWNVGNALAALAAGLQMGHSLEPLAAGLGRLEHVPGRMQRVRLGQPFEVVVDYAHTPAALALALSELRSATPGRLWVVFGSAGERDLSKRAEMGRIAAQLADQVVVTTEDPRDEDPEEIIAEICRGAVQAGANFEDNLHREVDRARAIALAVSRALPEDTVLLAGKGHEHSILTATGALPWDEVAAAESALRRRLSSSA
jgi:UDP-N-acetylmuramoyl-L-alanyl-D-glutamate--2,6-diaminopimelate ligase